MYHAVPEIDLEKQALLPFAFHKSFNGGIQSAKDPETTYFIGIIDILSRYTLLKRVERGLKRHFSLASFTNDRTRRFPGAKRSSFSFDGNETSAEEPVRYAERFVAFLDKIFI